MSFESATLHRPKVGRPKHAPWIFGAFAAVALFFLLVEHRAHLYGALPFLLLALCPLLHFFHGGHGRKGGPSGPDAGTRGRGHH